MTLARIEPSGIEPSGIEPSGIEPSGIERVRRLAEISTRALSDHLTQVSNADGVLGFVRSDWNGYAALRGTHLASAQQIGCYASHGLALEALRQRPRSI